MEDVIRLKDYASCLLDHPLLPNCSQSFLLNSDNFGADSDDIVQAVPVPNSQPIIPTYKRKG